MVDILNDRWILSEPVSDDEMKRFIGILMKEVGLTVPEYYNNNPMASMFPYIGVNEIPGSVTAWTETEPKHKDWKTLTVKELLIEIEKIIKKKNNDRHLQG